MATSVTRDQVLRLWLHRQGLGAPRGTTPLAKRSFTEHLARTGGLQLDTINVLDRAHWLTLWSRFGAFRRERVSRWIYRERAAFEYWGHEASILPIAHLPLARRRMRSFPPPSWTAKSWWKVYSTSQASRRRVLKRLRDLGPLESAQFEQQPGEFGPQGPPGGSMPLTKEDGRSLKLLWHAGRVAVHERRHFRCVYDLAERVYPAGPTATREAFEDSWLLIGLSGNGIASESHLVNYVTAVDLDAAGRRRVIARNVKSGRVVPVQVESLREPFFARPEDLAELADLPEPRGTTLLCPFDSLLWQRRRAEDLLGFRYRLEIYVPPAKREFGYYALPILHDGRLVGRLDPKLHRERASLEIRALRLEPGFEPDAGFRRGLTRALDELGRFVGAEQVEAPAELRGLVRGAG
jgi:uncharacterized protein YcaQ